jgi:hypothetical protein
MPPYSVASVYDGQRITVNDLIKQPTRVPALVLDMTKQGFMSDYLLRSIPASSPAVLYAESTPMYAGGVAPSIQERGEIPRAQGLRGQPRVVLVDKKGLAVEISDEMREDNDIDQVNQTITQVSNTMTKTWDTAFMSALDAALPVGNVIAASALWSTSTTRIRGDIASASQIVSLAKPTTSQGNDLFGFTPDTLVVPAAATSAFVNNDDLIKILTGTTAVADELSAYTGALPNKFLGLDVVSTPWLSNTAYVMQRKRLGFIADRRPLRVTPLYALGNQATGGPTETWRADVTRRSAVGIDQPFAAVKITGVL